MRIAIVADTYPPLRTSGAVQLRDLAGELARQGHEPVVIVPGGAQDDAWKLERGNGVTILRCRTPSTKDIGYVRRTINELRLPHAMLRALRESPLRDVRWDGVIWYSPSIFLAPIVRALRNESRCRSYLILRDIFPEWAVDMGLMKRGLAYRFFKAIEHSQHAVADTIGVQTPGNLAYLSDWARQPGRELEVLHNWLADAPIGECSISVAKGKLAGRKIFVYAGNMGVAQGIGVFIDLAERMRDRGDIGFLFVGRGSDAARLAALAESRGLDNVLFQDEIDPAEIPGLLAQCHVGVVALDLRHKTHNIPGKFLTYTQAGLPVLARINPGNDLESLISTERVGRVCTGGGADLLQDLAEQLLADPAELRAAGERGRRLWERLFTPSMAVRQIVSALSQGREASGVAAEVGLSSETVPRA